MSDLVTYSIRDAVAEIRLNRPDKKNAILPEMYAAVADRLIEAEADEAVRAIVLGGAGGSFTAGNDLSDFLDRPHQAEVPPVRRFMEALLAVQKPVIAAVDGVAVGIGVTLLLHCDWVLASARARLQAPFINLGLVPEFASSLLLPARIGRAAATRLLMLGESMDAQAALACGLVACVVEPAELDAAAHEDARRFAAKPAEAMRETKRLMRADPAVLRRRIDDENAVFARLLASDEARTAFAAFLQKPRRDPAGGAG